MSFVAVAAVDGTVEPRLEGDASFLAAIGALGGMHLADSSAASAAPTAEAASSSSASPTSASHSAASTAASSAGAHAGFLGVATRLATLGFVLVAQRRVEFLFRGGVREPAPALDARQLLVCERHALTLSFKPIFVSSCGPAKNSERVPAILTPSLPAGSQEERNRRQKIIGDGFVERA